MRVWSWMYETGPQVLSPVRKPNQVDTVTWDVTRDFYIRWRASTSSSPDPRTTLPVLTPVILKQAEVGDRLLESLLPPVLQNLVTSTGAQKPIFLSILPESFRIFLRDTESESPCPSPDTAFIRWASRAKRKEKRLRRRISNREAIREGKPSPFVPSVLPLASRRSL